MPSSRLIKPGLLFLPRLPWRRKRIACDPLFEMTILIRTTILPTIHLSMKPSILHFSWSHLSSYVFYWGFPSPHPCHPNPNVFYWGFSSPLPSHPTPSVFRNHTPMFFTEVSHLLVHTSQSKCFLLRFAISSSFPSNIKCFLLRFSHLLFLPLQKFVPEVVSSTFPSKIQSHPPSVTQQKLHMRVTAPPVCCEDDTWLQKVCCV